MNFASPPDIISPVSYPSSPESVRTPNFARSLPVPVTATDYSQAIQSDPFREEVIRDVADPAIVEAQKNAQVNNEINVGPPTPVKQSREDAVRDTLSRFAGPPRRPARSGEASKENTETKAQKSGMDVDAFKRLLLTGESGAANNTSAQSLNTPHIVSDSASSTDTASISQRSLFDAVPAAVEETPRSSYEQEQSDFGSRRQAPAETVPGTDVRRRPPPPKPRHGRPISEHPDAVSGTSIQTQMPSEAGSSTTTPQVPAEASQPDDGRRKPPPPPLSRRRSNRSATERPDVAPRVPSQQSLASESDDALSPQLGPSTPKMAPPPPPLRRTNTASSRKASSDLPSTAEEDESGTATPEAQPMSSQRPSGSKRVSQPSLVPPPLPPPRKNRASSKSSIDGQRPSLSGLGLTGSARSSGEYRRPSNVSEGGSAPGLPNATSDILADLAALQREVDAARAQSG